MKVIAINGSPRKNGNTATLLKEALNGAESKGAEVTSINLYDLNFKGCTSCFSCKRLGGASYGKCGMRDELTPVLESIIAADAVIFGSPIYIGNLTGTMRNLLERLIFQYLVYDKNFSTIAPKKVKMALIGTMGAPENLAIQQGSIKVLNEMNDSLARIFGSSELLCSMDTYQFDDYSKYEASAFDVAAKTKRREEQFPVDCQHAFQVGVKLASL